MPLIEVTAQKGTLPKDKQDDLMSQLSNAVLKAEGAPLDDNGAQSLVWAHYKEISDGAIYVGGKNLDQPPLRVAVTTPQGALNDTTRIQLIENIGSIVNEYIGPFEDRLNHWAMLYEVADGSWGAGNVFHLGDIQAAMNIKAA